MAGRPAKTRQEKEAQGTLEKSREPSNPITYEPLSEVPDVEVPMRGKDYFVHCCRAMIERGTLSAATINKVVRAAGWYDLWVRALDGIAKDGYIQSTKTGYKAFSPDVTTMEKAEKFLTEFEREYGLTLASSQKLNLPEHKGEDDDFD